MPAVPIIVVTVVVTVEPLTLNVENVSSKSVSYTHLTLPTICSV